MITINPPILMKKTKTKSCKKIKKVVSVKTKNDVKQKSTSIKKVVNEVKKPKITTDVSVPSKTLNKSVSSIEVPRSVKPEILDKNVVESTEESQFDINGERKKRRGRNKKEKIYFSKKTEDAIVEYNNEEDEHKRNNIYENKIKFSFEKLVENIFNTFKFTYFDNSPIEIQKEIVEYCERNEQLIKKLEEEIKMNENNAKNFLNNILK